MASRGVNKVILVGNLDKDPGSTLHAKWWRSCQRCAGYFQSWRDKATGEMKKQTEWHRVVLFGKLAEWRANICVKVLRFISKVSCVPVNRRINPVRNATPQKSW